MNFMEICFILALSFLLKENSGPWGAFSKIRSFLMNSGPAFSRIFFFGLFSCWFCIGFHSSWIVLLLSHHRIEDLFQFLQWGLTGSVLSLIFGGVQERLFRD